MPGWRFATRCAPVTTAQQRRLNNNGLKSIAQGFGGPDFWRVRVGVGRPDSTDPDVVARYVLSRFSESDDEVIALIERAAEHTERLVEEIASEDSDPVGEVID